MVVRRAMHLNLEMCLCTSLLLCVFIAVVKTQDTTTCNDGDVRLAGLPSKLNGRVEVCFDNAWGTICDDEWDDRDAQVVCRQLGFSGQGARAYGGVEAEYSIGSGPILFDNVECRGDEELLFNCSAQPIGDHNCNHFEDAGVLCEDAGFSCTDGDVRLLDGNTMYEGRVEICINDKFTTVCENNWSDEEAIVVCNQLNFTVGGRPIATPGNSFGGGVGTISVRGLNCNASESNLTECPRRVSLFDTCTHFDDAGVLCPRPDPPCADGEIRLSGGRISSEGFVEVCFNGHWGTICHRGWDEKDSSVVCGELGFSRNGSIAIQFGDLGRGDDLIFFSNVDCNGDEENLNFCNRNEITEHLCTHRHDSGVICADMNNTCTDGDMRLVDGATPNEGRLEICVRNHWGTVCDDLFDAVEASLVCRLLGFNEEGAVGLHAAYFGEGTGLIFLDDLECLGNESSLLNCSHRGIQNSNCFHNEDVSVLCQAPNSTCMNGEVRLVNGSGAHSGRVEVCFNGRFGSVCDDNWGADDAAVVCNQLGFPGEGAIGLSGAFYGEGSGPIFLDDSECSPANHSTLISCFDTENEVGVHNCEHVEDASVICPLGNRTCGEYLNGDIRLVGGSTELEGRVEVCLDGEWGTICDNFWSAPDAAVVCKQLTHGPTDAQSFGGAFFGQGTGSVHLDRFFCSGDEDRLTDCIHIPATHGNCGHNQDVGVICSAETCTNGNVRLVDGKIESEGRVEICTNGQFGTVCDDEWDSLDAAVVCRQLGYNDGEGAVALPRAFFGEGTSQIRLDDVRCIGNESSLLDCEHKKDPFLCFHFEDAGVLCQSPNTSEICTNGETRLTGGTTPHEGNVEVCFNGQWGTVCHDRWDVADAQTVCRSLGYDENAYVLPTRRGYFGIGTGIIFLDEVQCLGNETNILDCLSVSPGDHDCSHFLDAGVICSVSNSSFECQTGATRLMDGDSPHSGRVEVCVNGVWGTVCDDRWNENDAAVVCNQLGFGTEGAIAHGDAEIGGPGTGPIFLSNLGCTGNESNLFDCSFVGPGICRHDEDAGVTCKPPPCYDGEIRLFGGKTASEGNVEVCRNREWAGTVCDDLWDNNDAEVVCRHLGYSGEGAVSTRGAFFGQGTGEILLSNVNCRGNETSLFDCQSDSEFFCFHFEDAGVICPTNETLNCTTGDVRIVGGSNEYEGRVEVCLHGRWGTVCDDSWDSKDAAVVCRQLGYTDNGIAVSARLAAFGPGDGFIILDEVNCNGTESSLLDCRAREFGEHNCRPSEDASVFCPFVNSTCVNGGVQIVDGTSPDRGRVEFCVGGVWNTICGDSYWTNEDAQTVCRQLGFENPESAVAIVTGGGTGPIQMAKLECTGQESRITDCPVPDFALVSLSCFSHTQDAGVVCTPGIDNTTCVDNDVRLVNGEIENEGRVEICFNNQWGSVCDDRFGREEAMVVCRQLGYTYKLDEALFVPQGFFGRGFTPIHLDELSCVGNETSLGECQHPGVGQHNCQHNEDVGVICVAQNSSCSNGDVRLVNGRTEYEGRLEVCLGGRWGTVCNDLWDANDATVVCRQLGHSEQGAIATDTVQFGQGTELIFLDDLQCVGTETNILDCPSASPGTHNCFHNEDVGVICKSDKCIEGDVRLVGGSRDSEGTVEVCVSGEWGTVCDRRWDNREAAVVCKKLRYSGENAIGVIGAFFGAGSGDVLITSVNCRGNESTVTDCSYSNSTICTHSSDAGVICPPGTPQNCTDGDVRLVGSNNEYTGRVEVCLHGRWGGVCFNDWDSSDASVVCRQLGYTENGPPVPLTSQIPIGIGASPFFINNIQCSGSESSLLRCREVEIDSNTCRGIARVSCPSPSSACTNGDVRLVDGETEHSGRVEMCVSGVWNSLCGDFFTFWTDENAMAVCRQLNYTDVDDAVAIAVPSFSSRTPVLPHEYLCDGNETSLNSCQLFEAIFPECFAREFAGVICQLPTDPCTDNDVRLVNGAIENEGRVEICFNNQWGTVCDDSWGKDDARVVCRQLGYDSIEDSVAYRGAYFGQGQVPIHLDEVSCFGNESSLAECRHSGVGIHNCAHFEDAGVLCIANNASCTHGDIRLVGGPTELVGRVEVCGGGRWGTVCDDSFDQLDARVICRQLGFQADRALAVPSEFFGEGTGPIFLDELTCVGNESMLFDCPHSGVGEHNCAHREDVGVICTTATTEPPTNTTGGVTTTTTIAPVCSEGEVKLVNGSVATEGTVQLCQNNAWGTICDDLWDNTEAMVICRQLGFQVEGALSVRGAFFGRGNGSIYLLDVQCNGREANITQCAARDFHPGACRHFEDAGVICPPTVPVNCTTGDVRIVGGSNEYEGRVEVCLHGRWGTVCDDSWDSKDAAVVCNQLGYTDNGFPWGVPEANFGPGAGFIILDEVNCEGTESTLLECRASELGQHNCGPSEDAGVVCPYVGSSCKNGDVRLVNGETEFEGRPEVCIGGEWSTVCAGFYWDDKDARTICRQLGVTELSNVVAYSGAAYGEGTGPILFGSFNCTGDEESLYLCPTVGNRFARFGCTHSDDAGIQCINSNTTICDDGAIRLVGGVTKNEGRVEICFDNHWGTICDDDWGPPEAAVVCRQLGFGDGEGAVAIGRAYFGEGVGRIHLDDINCVRSEVKLDDCTHNGVRQHNCGHAEDAGVICLSENASCNYGDVRLVGGATEFEGRVEVCVGGRWGTVCDDLWDEPDASVVCRQVGLSPDGAIARDRAYFGQGQGPIYFDQTQCFGNETKLIDCTNSGTAVHNCVHGEDAAVTCLSPPCTENSFRLVGGIGNFTGIPQVCVRQEWGTVCGESFNTQAATAVCGGLDLDTSGALFVPGPLFEQQDTTSTTTFDLNASCDKDECTFNATLNPACSSNAASVAGVMCPSLLAAGTSRVCTSGDVRLAGGSVPSEGRLEVCLNNAWGTVCDDSWDNKGAAVVCKQLGLPADGAYAEIEGKFGEGTGPIYMDDVKCQGDESHILFCSQLPLGSAHNCDHTEDATVVCQGIIQPTKSTEKPVVGGSTGNGNTIAIIIPLVLIIVLLILIIIVVVVIFLVYRARKSGKLAFGSFEDERPIVHSDTFSSEVPAKDDSFQMTEKTDQL